MELTHEDVLGILELLERSSVDYLEVQIGDTRIVADRSSSQSGSSAPTVGGANSEPTHAGSIQVVHEPPATPSAAPRAVTEPRQGAAEVDARTDDLVTVAAPVVGIFYRTSEPGAPPYVEVGSRVQVGSTLGLVEVMKTFNSVSAEVAGTVTEILVENEAFVEHGQPLIRIRPS